MQNGKQIFKRWMEWVPHQQGWLSYINFELRYNEVERARQIFERFVECHLRVSAWIRFSKFEMKNGEIARARNCYERAVNKLGGDEEAEELFIAFDEFEEKCKETERARCIYKFALDHIPKEELYNKFIAFEKQYGDREGIEDSIDGKIRFHSEDEVRKDPLDYDVWFEYIRLEEKCGDMRRIEDVYERAIANLPPAQEKRYWQRDANPVVRRQQFVNYEDGGMLDLDLRTNPSKEGGDDVNQGVQHHQSIHESRCRGNL